jgi:YfiH family protein
VPKQKTQLHKSPESAAAIAAVDNLLAAGGLEHGKRLTRKGLHGPRREKNQLRDWKPKGKFRKVNNTKFLTEPQWNQQDWLIHAFSTRQSPPSKIYSGESEIGELDLSWTQEYDSKAVAANRELFTQAVTGGKIAQLVTLRQVHSNILRNLDLIDKEIVRDGKATLRGDAMMTSRPGLLLGIQTADCVPVFVADRDKRVIASFHAGWRGILSRIVERGIGTMRLTYGCNPKNLKAIIGPGIGPCCYAVNEELRKEFESQFHYAAELFCEVYDSDPIRDKYPMLFLTQRAPGHSPIGPQLHLDLWEANRLQLIAAGLQEKNISVLAQCTSCHPEHFFSHRRDHGFTGRMMNVIGIARKPTKKSSKTPKKTP